MGQITKIAFELRNLTQQTLDNMDSDDDEEDMDEATMLKRQEISEWIRFCNDKVDKIQKVWEQKLGQDNQSSDTDSEQDNKEADDEARLEAMFKNFGKEGKSKSFMDAKKEDELRKEVAEANANSKPESKDDSHVIHDSKPEFSDA